MRNITLLTLLFFFSLSYFNVQAQDEHYAQYRNYQQFLNPAAFSHSTNEIGLQHRTQWANIVSPYQSALVYGTHQMKDWTIGAQFTQNGVKDSGYKNTTLMASLAYQKPLTEKSILRVGVDVGFYQIQLDQSLLTFENQFTSTGQFDGSLASGENINPSLSKPDFVIGLAWQNKISDRVTFELGASLAHAHQPIVSLIGDTERLARKVAVQARLQRKINQQFSLAPHLIYAQQCCGNEILVGVEGIYSILETTDILFDLSYRAEDAFIVGAGLEMNQFRAMISYDFNTSPLKAATNGNGGFEIGLAYLFNTPKSNKPKQAATPTTPVYVLPTDTTNAYPNRMKDKDEDGIVDWYDACPSIPGPPENKGCPVKEKDTDGDGIVDSEDECVYMRGILKFKGCPDTDRDGTPDIEDDCPFIKGKPADNGCPKEMTDQQGTINQGIKAYSIEALVEFDTDQSFVKPQYYFDLDEVVAMMQQNANAKMMLAGHTDAEGSQAYNYALSHRRSESVKAYFVKRGVAPSRITFYSYGETKPLSNNDSMEGKARNRRVEVLVVF